MNQWSQNINKTEFPGVWMFCVIFIPEFYHCIPVITVQYHNPYNASALINAPNRFSENNVLFFFQLHELLHWMMSLHDVMRSPLETKEFAPRGANNFLSELRSPVSLVG